MGLGGGMVWSIDTEDFQGFCSGKKFPLLNVIDEVLNGGPQTSTPDWTTPTGASTTTKKVITTPDPDNICKPEGGLKPDPGDTTKF